MMKKKEVANEVHFDRLWKEFHSFFVAIVENDQKTLKPILKKYPNLLFAP